jgi:hypothetical protein
MDAPAPDPAALRLFAEEMGLVFEHSGGPPLAGRVLGWLLVCDPPHQTAGEIGAALGASKAGISGALRTLQLTGLVEPVAVPGSRAEHVQVKVGAFSRVLDDKLSSFAEMQALAQRGLDLLDDAGAPRRARLAELHRFYTFLLDEMSGVSQRWAALRGPRRSP